MSASPWAGDTTLPLTSWRDGTHVYVSATPLPLTPAQAREAASRLLAQAEEIELGGPLIGRTHSDRELERLLTEVKR